MVIYNQELHESTVGVATWNILADGLSLGEFMNKDGDSVVLWQNRGPRVASCIQKMLSTPEISIVVTQENDHASWILNKIQEIDMPYIKMVRRHKGKNSEKFYISRLRDELMKEGYYSEEENAKICEFECNAGKPGCKLKTPQCIEKCASEISESLRKNPNVREILTKKGMTCTTYEDEHEESNNPSDIYHSMDCLAVYYDSQTVKLKGQSDENATVFRLDFTHLHSQEEFSIFPAHLKSGEDKKGEIERVKELRLMLDEAKKYNNPIILMDSNTCMQYKGKIQDELSGEETDDFNYVHDVIESNGFKNVIDESDRGNKCFKMRHARGGQPKKFGELFYDTIDKICVQKPSKIHSIVLHRLPCNFQVLPVKHAKVVDKWRNDSEWRNKLKEACIDGKWGPNMEDNSTVNFDTFRKEENCDDRAFINTKEILLELYPNEYMPSDHPPAAVLVELGTEANQEAAIKEESISPTKEMKKHDTNKDEIANLNNARPKALAWEEAAHIPNTRSDNTPLPVPSRKRYGLGCFLLGAITSFVVCYLIYWKILLESKEPSSSLLNKPPTPALRAPIPSISSTPTILLRPSVKPTSSPSSLPSPKIDPPSLESTTKSTTILVENESIYFVDQTVRNQCGSIAQDGLSPTEALISCMEICIPAKGCLDSSVPANSVLCRTFESCISSLRLDYYDNWESKVNRLGSTPVNQALIAGIAVQSCFQQRSAYQEGKELCDAVCFDTECCFSDSTACPNDYQDDKFCEIFDGCWRENV